MNTDKVDASVFVRAHPWLKNQTRVFWRAVQPGWATGSQRMDDLRPALRGRQGRQEGEVLRLGGGASSMNRRIYLVMVYDGKSELY